LNALTESQSKGSTAVEGAFGRRALAREIWPITERTRGHNPQIPPIDAYDEEDEATFRAPATSANAFDALCAVIYAQSAFICDICGFE
jgi:hypothetical protein